MKTHGPAAIVAAAVLWGTAGTAGLLASDATPVSLAAARLVIGGAVLALLARRRLPAGLSARRWSTLVFGAVAVAAYQLCFFAAVATTGVAIGTVVAIGSGPVFTGALSWWLDRRPPGARWAAGTAAAIAGCVLLILGGLVTGGGPGVGADPAGVLLALLGGLLYASYAVIAARQLAQGSDSTGVMGVLFGGAAAIMLPILLVTGPGWLAGPRGLGTALYLGCAATALAYVLYGRGLRGTPVASAATLALAEPAVAALLGVVVLREHLSPVSWAGLALLAVSLAVVAAPGRARDRSTGRGGRTPDSVPV
ncbi:EamA family transporter [Streptosporangiaceae bacterium NEAU-GS5]|nr:EamA family transporter [Streptosporangiaceae bacterium NEAU-GS5]